MEIQRPPSPNPTSCNISSHHGSSPALPPLPEASTSAGFTGGSHHRRSHSDGSFFGAGVEAEEDLVAAFLDIQKLSRNDDSGSGGVLMDHDGGGLEKGVRLRQRGSGVLEGLGDMNEVKKAISTEKLAEIWAVDPKRVKRILANRQSAARSKERKARYISELERRVQSLQTEATHLSAQLTIYQRDTTGLITENAELKIRLQAMEQQARLCDALNEALQQEVERLKVAGGDRKAPSEALTSSAPQLVPYSSLTSPPTLRATAYSPAAALPMGPAPMLAQLPPLNSSPPCHRPCAPAAPEQNEPLCRLPRLDINSIGLPSPPVAATPDARSTKELLTP